MAEEFDALKRSRARAYLESVRAERVKVDGPDRRMAPCDAEGAGR